MHKYINDIKTGRMLFAMCWLVYAAAYTGRMSYYTALTGMIGDCGFLKSEAGLIGTAFFFCYGCGQAVNGILGDRLSPFKMIFTGLTLSAAANFCIGFCGNYAVMTVIWGFNGFAQSMLWSPILYIFVHVLHPELRNKAYLYITASIPAGTVATYLFSMVILRHSKWNLIFLTSGTVLSVTAVLWLCASLYSSRCLTEEDPGAARIKPDKNLPRSPDSLFSLLAVSGGVIMLFAILIHGMLKEGVSVWVPTMISETYHFSSSFSVFLSMFLPIVSLIGPYAVDYLYKKRLRKDEVKAAAVCLIFTIPPLCILFFIGSLPAAVCVAMLALVSAAINAFNYITVTMIPVRFSCFHKASTATGLFNSVTYIGCAISTYGFGLLSERFGWNYTVAFWISLAAAGIIFCFCAMRRWQKFMKSQNI